MIKSIFRFSNKHEGRIELPKTRSAAARSTTVPPVHNFIKIKRFLNLVILISGFIESFKKKNYINKTI